MMAIRFVRAAAGMLLAAACLVASPALADTRRLTLDDMMSLEGLAAARFDPQGRWLVFEKLRPYDKMEDYSFRTYAFEKSGHQLWRYDVAAGGEAERLPGIDPDRSTYLEGFSPDGRYLAVMQYWLGELRLSAYDMQAERLVSFGPTPAFSRLGTHNPVWISDTEIVYAALPDGELPDETSIRARVAADLSKAWTAAFRGTGATAVEFRTGGAASTGAGERGSLLRGDARTGQLRVLAEGLYGDLRVAPGGRWLAALAMSVPRPLAGDRGTIDDRRQYTLALFDLDAGTEVDIAPGLEFVPYSITWSADGQKVAAYGWKQGQGPGSGRFYVYDVRTQTLVSYDHTGLDLVSERERGGVQRPERAVFLGGRLAVFARPLPPGDPSARFTYRDIRPEGLESPGWYLISASGEPVPLTAGLNGVSPFLPGAGSEHMAVLAADGVYRVDRDGHRQLTVPGPDQAIGYRPQGTFATRSFFVRPALTSEALLERRQGPARALLLADIGAGQLLQSVSADAGTKPLAASKTGRAIAYLAETGMETQLRIVSPKTGPAGAEVTRINAHLSGVELGTWDIVAYEAGGRRLESCVLLPPGFDPSFPPPLIVDVYPGAGPRCRQGGAPISYADPHSPYLWSARGYAYARLTTPTDLIRTPAGPIAGIGPVIDAGIDALAARGMADPGRLVLHGYSQGGITALYLASLSGRYKAVIAKNGWADLFSHYFGAEGVYAYVNADFIGGESARYDGLVGSDFAIGRTPFDDPEAYYRNSPVYRARGITAPVLLFHSDMDIFSMSQFDQMYGALRRAGKEARYVRYWGEGHGPSSPPNIRDMWARIDAFLSEQGVPPEGTR